MTARVPAQAHPSPDVATVKDAAVHNPGRRRRRQRFDLPGAQVMSIRLAEEGTGLGKPPGHPIRGLSWTRSNASAAEAPAWADGIVPGPMSMKMRGLVLSSAGKEGPRSIKSILQYRILFCRYGFSPGRFAPPMTGARPVLATNHLREDHRLNAQDVLGADPQAFTASPCFLPGRSQQARLPHSDVERPMLDMRTQRSGEQHWRRGRRLVLDARLLGRRRRVHPGAGARFCRKNLQHRRAV